MAKCLVRHHRPEIRTPNSDIDDVSDGLTGMAFPLAAPNAVREGGHLIEDGVNRRNNVLSVDHYGRTSWRPQGDVQDCAFLGDVDPFATKHRVDSVLQTRFSGQLNKKGKVSEVMRFLE